MVREANPRALPIVALAGLGTMAVLVVLGVVLNMIYLIPLGVLLGLLVAMIMFGRFAQAAQFSAIEGQPGAAAAVLQTMRGNWTVTPAIAANRNMDVVHRAVGRAGVVLVGEGSPTRLPSLLAAEKKRVARVAYDIPIYDIQVGNEEGQIPIRRLQRRIMKLPRNLQLQRGIGPELPAQGPAAVAAGAQGPDAEARQAAEDAPAADALRAAFEATPASAVRILITIKSGRRPCSPPGHACRAGLRRLPAGEPR